MFNIRAVVQSQVLGANMGVRRRCRVWSERKRYIEWSDGHD